MTASNRVQPAAKPVLEQRREMSDELNRLLSLADDDESAMQQGVAALQEEQRKLLAHVQHRASQVTEDLNGLGSQLSGMHEMAQFSGGEALSTLVALVNATAVSEARLRDAVDNQVTPQTDVWREGVNEVLEHFGLSLNYEQLLADANAAYEREKAVRKAIGEADLRVAYQVRRQQMISEKALEKERMAMRALVHEVLQNQEMDAAEKAQRIRQIQEEAAEKRAIVEEKAKLIAMSEQAAELSVDEQEHLLHTLVARAQHSQDNKLNPPSHDDNAVQRQALAQDMDHLGEELRGTAKMSSLLQVSGEQDSVRRAMAGATAGESGEAGQFQHAADAHADQSDAWLQDLSDLEEGGDLAQEEHEAHAESWLEDLSDSEEPDPEEAHRAKVLDLHAGLAGKIAPGTSPAF